MELKAKQCDQALSGSQIPISRDQRLRTGPPDLAPSRTACPLVKQTYISIASFTARVGALNKSSRLCRPLKLYQPDAGPIEHLSARVAQDSFHHPLTLLNTLDSKSPPIRDGIVVGNQTWGLSSGYWLQTKPPGLSWLPGREPWLQLFGVLFRPVSTLRGCSELSTPQQWLAHSKVCLGPAPVILWSWMALGSQGDPASQH